MISRSRTEEHFVCIDVGTESAFEIRYRPDESCDVLRSTSSSVALKIQGADASYVYSVKWSRSKALLSPPSTYRAISLMVAGGIEFVPKYLGGDIYLHEGTYVRVELREYIEGASMSSVYSTLSAEDLHVILLQISRLVEVMESYNNSHFGYLKHGRLRTTTPIGYIRQLCYRHSLPMVNLESSYECKPTLCHLRLNPCHIILNGRSVVGVLGWDYVDFMPRAMCDLSYEVKSRGPVFGGWYAMLRSMFGSDGAPTDMIYALMSVCGKL